MEGCGKDWRREELFRGFAGGQALAALALHLGRAPGMGGATVEALTDVAAQALDLRGVQLIVLLHEAKRFADDFEL